MQTKKSLLILHNGSARDGAKHVSEYFSNCGLEPSTYWAAGDEFPDDVSRFDGCFLTGSPHGAYESIPWIEHEHELIRQMAAAKMPLLGVCFGSQILGSALCGRDQLFRRPDCEVGFLSLPLTSAGRADPLMAELDQEVEMFIWHNDEVKASHPDMVILASSPDCPNQIWRYKNRPIWGIQGHPELTRQTALNLFDEDAAVFERDGANLEQLRMEAHDAPEAKTMLNRFAQMMLTGFPTMAPTIKGGI